MCQLLGGWGWVRRDTGTSGITISMQVHWGEEKEALVHTLTFLPRPHISKYLPVSCYM